MSALKSAGIIICVCCVACSIFSLIAPTGRMKKMVSLILGMFLICSMIIPIKGLFDSLKIGFNIDDSKYSIENMSDSEYNELVLKQTADNLVGAANNLLISENIYAQNIRVGLKISEDNSIYISSIYIYITNEYQDRQEEISKIITNNMSKEPELIIQ